jgi:hypothetical protein
MRNRELGGFSRAALSRRIGALTRHHASVCIDAVKWLALLLLIAVCGLTNSCTTLVNRRDLYSPEPAPDSLEAARQWYGIRTTSTTPATRTRRPSAEALPPPDVPQY